MIYDSFNSYKWLKLILPAEWLVLLWPLSYQFYLIRLSSEERKIVPLSDWFWNLFLPSHYYIAFGIISAPQRSHSQILTRMFVFTKMFVLNFDQQFYHIYFQHLHVSTLIMSLVIIHIYSGLRLLDPTVYVKVLYAIHTWKRRNKNQNTVNWFMNNNNYHSKMSLYIYIFFFLFRLFPLGDATANQCPPSNPVFCVLFSHTNYLHVHFMCVPCIYACPSIVGTLHQLWGRKWLCKIKLRQLDNCMLFYSIQIFYRFKDSLYQSAVEYFHFSSFHFSPVTPVQLLVCMCGFF